MPGLGTVSIGSTPFGIGTPVSVAAPPSGTAVGVRFLNPITRDYQQDPDTLHLAQMPILRQRVYLAMMTIKRSATAVPGFGILLPPKLAASWRADVSSAVRTALRRLTDVERIMRIESIGLTKSPGGRVLAIVKFVDLDTGESDEQGAIV